MIRWPDRPRSPADRLLAPLAVETTGGPITLVIGFEDTLDPASIPERARGVDRLLAIGWLGVHRDAPVPELRRQWDLEEAARASGLPTLALRLGPLIGPASPLWRHLERGAPGLDRERLLMPVVEDDAIETLRRAFTDPEAWADWYEVAGPEALTVGELVERAAGAASGPARAATAWEPSLGILRAQRLADPAPWLERFRLAPPPLAERIRGWAT